MNRNNKPPWRTFLWIALLVACAGCGGYSYEMRLNGSALRYTWSWDGFHMAYTVERDGVADLFVTNGDWSDCTRIDVSATGTFAWSPDGTRLAYLTKDRASGQYSLHTVRADGSDRRDVSTGWTSIGAPLWSPDSSRLAFTTTGFLGHVSLHTARADGSGVAEIDTEPLFLNIVWSADSSQVAYRVGTDFFGTFELRSAAADGSGHEVVSGTGNVRAGGIVWCRGDTRLLYLADEETPGIVALYSARPDGSDRQRMSGSLDAGREVLGDFACSADGVHVAYGTARADGVTELYVTTWDGGTPHRVAEHLERFLTLPVFRWSPDGSWLALRTTARHLFTFDPSTHALLEVDLDVESGFSWAPDGRHLAYLSAGWLHTAAAGGGAGTPIAQSDPGFVWSPDADALLFVSDGLHTVGIHDGSKSLVSDLGIVGEPAWLRTANRIVFRGRDPDGAVNLYRASPYGGAVRIACTDSR